MRVAPVPSQKPPPEDAHTFIATDQPRFWWGVENDAKWSAFLATNQDKIPPILCHGAEGVVFLAAEQAVFALREDTGALLATVGNASDVRSVFKAADDLVLAVAADQVLAFRASGALLWRQSLPDLVDDVQVELDVVKVSDISGANYQLSFQTGLPIKPR